MNREPRSLFSAACIAAGLLVSAQAAAQAYPEKAIRLVVGFTAGGPTDILARTVGQSLSQAFGQPVIVDNRAGAASNIAADYVAKSAADGYTLMFGSQSLANNATLYSKLPYNALRDFAPVVRVANTPFMLCVHPSLPVTSKQRFETLGCETAGGTPAAFAAYFRGDIEKWAKVIRDAGVHLE